MKDELRVAEAHVALANDAGLVFVARDDGVEALEPPRDPRHGMEFFMDVPPGADAVALTYDCAQGRIERGGWPTRDTAAADEEC